MVATLGISLTEEQVGLQDSVRTFFSGEAPLALVRRVFEGGAFDASTIRAGCTTLGLSELFTADGGGAFRELGLIATEVGRALFPLPIVEELYCQYLAERTANAPWSARDRICIVAGETRTAIRGAAEASIALILGANRQMRSIVLKPEMKRQGSYIDRTMVAADLSFQESDARPVSWTGGIDPLLGLRLLAAAELSGIATKVVEMTVAYVQTRKQFGVAIGGFQAVAHKLADMHLQAEAVRTLTEFGLWAAESCPEQHEFSALSALQLATEEVPKIVETAVQLHGGIGFTWEYDIHLYLRRACMIEATHRTSLESVNNLLAAAGRQ